MIMFEDDKTISESKEGGFLYDKRELRVCLFLHSIQIDEYNPLQLMKNTVFMLGIPAASEIGGMITVKNPAKDPKTFRIWKISPIDENETREHFVRRFWHCWNEAKEKILELHGENISIMYEGKLLDGVTMHEGMILYGN